MPRTELRMLAMLVVAICVAKCTAQIDKERNFMVTRQGDRNTYSVIPPLEIDEIDGTRNAYRQALIDKNKIPCTIFGGDRYAQSHENLKNCSWYSQSACCRRTEVSSVFDSMPLFTGASAQCSALLNYLMCYFCSPEQYRWHNVKTFVCEKFCNDTYDACRDAMVIERGVGRPIRDIVKTGRELCEKQNFGVREDGPSCYKFDSTKFSAAPRCMTSVCLCTLLVLLCSSLCLLLRVV